LVAEYLDRTVPAHNQVQMTAEEIETGFEEIADLLPAEVPPLSDSAVSRDSFYTREDDWNRPSSRI
jgi:hypothetical protein